MSDPPESMNTVPEPQFEKHMKFEEEVLQGMTGISIRHGITDGRFGQRQWHFIIRSDDGRKYKSNLELSSLERRAREADRSYIDIVTIEAENIMMQTLRQFVEEELTNG